MPVVLSKKEFSEKYSNVLMHTEGLIVHTFNKHPEMHDQDIIYVLDGLLKYFRAKLTNFPIPTHAFSEYKKDLYETIRSELENKHKELSLHETFDCLKFLKTSVEFWTKEGGSRGYLSYITKFLTV